MGGPGGAAVRHAGEGRVVEEGAERQDLGLGAAGEAVEPPFPA
jgi:hypothetical protein